MNHRNAPFWCGTCVCLRWRGPKVLPQYQYKYQTILHALCCASPRLFFQHSGKYPTTNRSPLTRVCFFFVFGNGVHQEVFAVRTDDYFVSNGKPSFPFSRPSVTLRWILFVQPAHFFIGFTYATIEVCDIFIWQSQDERLVLIIRVSMFVRNKVSHNHIECHFFCFYTNDGFLMKKWIQPLAGEAIRKTFLQLTDGSLGLDVESCQFAWYRETQQ